MSIYIDGRKHKCLNVMHFQHKVSRSHNLTIAFAHSCSTHPCACSPDHFSWERAAAQTHLLLPASGLQGRMTGTPSPSPSQNADMARSCRLLLEAVVMSNCLCSLCTAVEMNGTPYTRMNKHLYFPMWANAALARAYAIVVNLCEQGLQMLLPI